MKKLKLSKQDKDRLLAELSQKIDEFNDDLYQDKFSFEKDLKESAKDKITILFTPEAYLKSQMLVKTFSGEVGWHGLVDKLDNKTYRVYDIMVYPQNVSGARTLDPTATNDWYEKYEDVLDSMHFQAHSHVNMSTSASGTDLNNQKEIVKNCGGEGFKLFQIWNKSGDINSYLYDLDNNLLYDRNDVVIEIETSDGVMSDFIAESKELVEDMPSGKIKYAPQPAEITNYEWAKSAKVKTKPVNSPFYWSDGMGHEGWDDDEFGEIVRVL